MLEFDEQLSRLQKPDREEMTDEEYAVFNKNVEVMEKNWGLHQQPVQDSSPERQGVHRIPEFQEFSVQ